MKWRKRREILGGDTRWLCAGPAQHNIGPKANIKMRPLIFKKVKF
jgi:hypothetical protein